MNKYTFNNINSDPSWFARVNWNTDEVPASNDDVEIGPGIAAYATIYTGPAFAYDMQIDPLSLVDIENSGSLQANSIVVQPSGSTTSIELQVGDGASITSNSSIQLGAGLSIGGDGITAASHGTINADISFTSANAILQFDTTDSFTFDSLISGSGSVVSLGGPGTIVTLSDVNNNYSGGTTIEGGGSLELDANGSAGTGAITFAPGADARLIIARGPGVTNTIVGFGVHDEIDFVGVAYAAADYVTFTAGGAGGVVTIDDSSGVEMAGFIVAGAFTAKNFTLSNDGSGHLLVGVASAKPDDFNGDGTSDLLWYNSSTSLFVDWSFVNGVHKTSSNVGTAPAGWNAIGTGDFNGDGTTDILFQNATSGIVVDWDEQNGVHTTSDTLGTEAPSSHWSLAGTGDFNGDGTSDLLWRNSSTGQVMDWTIRNDQVASSSIVGTVGAPWTIVGTGDFNGDGTSDILWENTSSKQLLVWEMLNGVHTKSTTVGTIPTGWTYVGNGDFVGNGTDDPLFEYTDGSLVTWKLSNGVLQSGINLGLKVPSGFAVSEIGDFNGDGISDVMLYNKTTGVADLGLVNSSGHVSQWTAVGSASPSTWHIAA